MTMSLTFPEFSLIHDHIHVPILLIGNALNIMTTFDLKWYLLICFLMYSCYGFIYNVVCTVQCICFFLPCHCFYVHSFLLKNRFD